jgi:hypothetical protein
MDLAAHAQDAQVKFTLTHAVHVGSGVLPAGRYIMSVTSDGSTRAIITPVDRKGVAVIALPVSTDSYAACRTTSVSMLQDGASWTLRSACFADAGLALYFPALTGKTALASAASEPASIAGSR